MTYNNIAHHNTIHKSRVRRCAGRRRAILGDEGRLDAGMGDDRADGDLAVDRLHGECRVAVRFAGRQVHQCRVLGLHGRVPAVLVRRVRDVRVLQGRSEDHARL
eukprot:11789083-Heterocapsa_arctica.AAC.1